MHALFPCRATATAAAASEESFWDPAGFWAVSRPLAGHDGPVNGLAFSPDGRRLASASGDGTVRLSAAPRTWISLACERAGRNPTQAEWEEYRSSSGYVRLCEQYPAGAGADPASPLAEYPALPDVYLRSGD